jgi:hypothetical protein
MNKPPKYSRPRPSSLLTFEQAIELIRQTYDARNNPRFEWDSIEG